MVLHLERVKALAADLTLVLEGRTPERIAPRDAPVLERWFLARRAEPCLVGLSTGHPLLPGDGRPIATSELWLLSEDRMWARTLSRWYRLGRPARWHELHS